MGAEFITSGKVIAGNAKAAFNWVVEQDEYEYGHEMYNGSFTTTDFAGVRKTLDGKYTPNKAKRAYAFIEKDADNVAKRDAWAVDLGVVDYTVTRVKARKVTSKGKAKTKYVVCYDDHGEAFYDTLDAAKNFALKKALNSNNVTIEKRAVYQGGSAIMKFERVQRQYKKRPTRVPKDATVVERHMYVFYAWAAC